MIIHGGRRGSLRGDKTKMTGRRELWEVLRGEHSRERRQRRRHGQQGHMLNAQ